MKLRLLPTARLSFPLATAIAALLAISSAHATTLYWDVNDTATAFSTVVGTWGTNVWNDTPSGTGGTTTAVTTNADDLNIVAATVNTGTITVSSAQVANSLTFSSTVGAVTISGAGGITLGNGTPGAGGITLSGGSANQVVSTAITLANSQTWTNSSAGVLSFGGGLTLGGNTLTFAGSGNFTATAGTFGNAGAGGIIMNGTGVLNVRAATNTNYTGSTTINSGVVLLNAATKSTGNFNLNGGMVTDYFQQAGTFSSGLGTGVNQIQIYGDSGFGAGNGASTWTIGTAASSLQWGSTNFSPTTLKFLTSADNMGPTIFGQVNLNNGLDLNGAARTISVLAATGTDAISSSIATISGNITSASGSITKTGGGNLRLSGTNSYGGGTTISLGMVRFAAKASMPNSGAVSVSAGATLGILINNGGTGWGGGTGNGGIAGLVNNGLGGQAGGTVSFAAGNSSLFLDATANTTESNALGNGGATNLSLVKYGTSTLTLSGNNTFSGSVAVGAGTLVLSGTNTYAGGTSITVGTAQFGKLVSMPATGTVAVNGGTLAVNLGGTGEWTTGTSGNGTLGGLIAASAVGGQGNTVTWAGASAVGLDTTNAPGTQTYGTAIVNRGTSLGVTKLGAGTLTLSGTNTYTGTTTVNAGTLNMSGTFGNHPITVNGGLLNFTSSSGGNGLVTIAGGTFLYAGTKTAGSVSQTAGTLQIGTATTSGLGQIVIVGTISSNNTTARTFTPRFVMNGPITLGDPVNNGKLTFTDAGGTSTTGSAARVLTVLSDAEFTTALGGTGGITKEGAATLTLSGASSNYSSTTTVNRGLFALGNGGNLTGATNVTVNAGTFGIRQNASATTNSVGSGASTFTLATGSALSMADGFTSTLNLVGSAGATLAPASGIAPVLTFDLIGANSDKLAITGAATVGAAKATIAITPGSTPIAGTSYTVITAASGLNANFQLANPLVSTPNGLLSLAFTGSSATTQVVTVSDDPDALYWSGATDGDWNTAANWNATIAGGVVSGSAPVSTTNVAFGTTTPVAANLSNSLSAPLTVNSINFLPGTGPVTIGGSNLITVGASINDNSATNQTFNAPLAVTGNINKTGSGTLTLGGSNTISGAVTLSAGTLQLQNGNAITSTSGITSSTTSAMSVAAGTTLQLRANANTNFNTGLITLPSGTVNIDVANNGSGTSNTLTLGTALVSLNGGSNISLITSSSNSATTLNITGGNSYGLAMGRIQQPSGVAGSAFTVNAGTVPVSITQFQAGSFGSNFIAGSGTITLGTTGVPGFTQGSNGSNTVTVNSGATLIMATAVGSYNARAGGTYSTVLNSGGTLVVNNAGALANTGTGSIAPTFIINGGTLDSTFSGGITITAGTLTSPNITLNADFAFAGSQNLNLGTGTVSLAGGTRTVTVTANTLTVGGVISGGALTKAGVGTLALNGANTYSGATTVSAGVLAMGANNVLADSSAVSIGAGTLDATTFDDTVGALDVTNAASAINLGTGANLAFADSSAVDWTGGSLAITGTFVSGSSLRFGTTSGGLTPIQLGLITGVGPVTLDSSGFLVTSGGGNTYADWLTLNAPATGFVTDSDNDGLSNGVENVLGSNPNTYNPGLTEVSATPTSVVFKHTLNPTIASDVTYSYQWSTDMVEWKATTETNTGGTTATIVPSAPALGVVTVTITITGGPSAKLFGRLVAVK